MAPLMPNKPRDENPARPVRVEEELWARVKALAKRRSVTASEVVRTAIREHVARSEADR